MKKLIVILATIDALILHGFVYGADVPAGQNLVPPTVNSRIVEDTSGNMNFIDASAGPVKLSQMSPLTGFTVPAGNIQFGSQTTAISSATTTSGQGTVFTAFLASGAWAVAAAQGSVLIATTTQNNLITVAVAPALGNQSMVVGIATAAASTGTVVSAYCNGWPLALSTGAINPGDTLMTAANGAGYLIATTYSTNPIVGIALQARPANTSGLIKIRLQ